MHRIVRRFSSASLLRFNLKREQEIRSSIDSLPTLDLSKIYTYINGDARLPKDEELKSLARLNTLTDGRKVGFFEFLRLSDQESEIYMKNDRDLQKLDISSSKIVDKVPYEDASTGEVKWKVVREGQKEGWEKIGFFLLVPTWIALLAIILFKDDKDLDSWAMDELMLRVKEKGEKINDLELLNAFKKMGQNEENLNPAELSSRDSVIIERILSNEYDRLNDLKKRSRPLPILDAEQ